MYFRLRFGLENTVDTYSRLILHVVLALTSYKFNSPYPLFFYIRNLTNYRLKPCVNWHASIKAF